MAKEKALNDYANRKFQQVYTQTKPHSAQVTI